MVSRTLYLIDIKQVRPTVQVLGYRDVPGMATNSSAFKKGEETVAKSDISELNRLKRPAFANSQEVANGMLLLSVS